MKKNIILCVLALMVGSASNWVVAQVPNQSPSYTDGYNDGYAEGKRIGLRCDFNAYTSFSDSYQSYSARFPGSPNIPYFQGKYHGLYYGWSDWACPTPPNGGGGGGPSDGGGGPVPHEN